MVFVRRSPSPSHHLSLLLSLGERSGVGWLGVGRSLSFVAIIGISTTSVASGVAAVAACVDGARAAATLVRAATVLAAAALVLVFAFVARAALVLVLLFLESGDGGGDLLDAGVLGELLAGVDTYGGGQSDGQHVGGQHGLGGYGGVTVLLGVGLHVLVADAAADPSTPATPPRTPLAASS